MRRRGQRMPGAPIWQPGLRRERGLVLYIALIVMVAMALAAIALIRSTDTGTLVTGNLVLKQAAMSAVDRSVEHAIHALWDPPLHIADPTRHSLTENYYACVRNAAGTACLDANSPIPDVPAVLASPDAFSAAGLSTGLIVDDDADNKSYFVIERMCLDGAVGVKPTGNNCNLSSASMGADPGTQHYEGLIRPGNAYYRVTVMVTGPRNTVAYAQAMLQ